MSAMASQIISLTIVYSTFYSGADQRKHQSSASLASVRGIHRWSMNSPHKGLVTRKIFPFDDVIMLIFADASRVNLYHSYHPVSWMQQSTNLSTKRRKTQVRPLQCRGWPWIHNTSHTRPVLTIPVTMLVHQHSGGGDGDDHKSVQRICDTSVILDIRIWERPRFEDRTIISIITCRIFFEIIATLVTQMRPTYYLWVNWGNPHSREKRLSGPKNFAKGSRGVFHISSVCYWHWCRFPSAVRPNGRSGRVIPLRWRHNGHDAVSNHQPHECLLNRLFGRRSKWTSKLRVTGLCVGNSPGTGEFPAQMASNAENVSIWWRHHSIELAGGVCISYTAAL